MLSSTDPVNISEALAAGARAAAALVTTRLDPASPPDARKAGAAAALAQLIAVEPLLDQPGAPARRTLIRRAVSAARELALLVDYWDGASEPHAEMRAAARDVLGYLTAPEAARKGEAAGPIEVSIAAAATWTAAVFSMLTEVTLTMEDRHLYRDADPADVHATLDWTAGQLRWVAGRIAADPLVGVEWPTDADARIDRLCRALDAWSPGEAPPAEVASAARDCIGLLQPG